MAQYHSWREEVIKPATTHAMSQRIAPHAKGTAMRMNSSASPGRPTIDPDAASPPLLRTDIRIQRAIPASEPKNMMRFASKRIRCMPSFVFISNTSLVPDYKPVRFMHQSHDECYCDLSTTMVRLQVSHIPNDSKPRNHIHVVLYQ